MSTKSKGTKLHPTLRVLASKIKKIQDLATSDRNSKSICKAINESTQKCCRYFCQRAKKNHSTIANKVTSVNRTESNDLRTLKEFCDIKNIVCPPIPPMTITEVPLMQIGTRGLGGLDGKNT